MQSSMQTTIESTGALTDLFYLITGGYVGLFLLGLVTVSYTHLTLPTICSV